jgi:hypothetical protein
MKREFTKKIKPPGSSWTRRFYYLGLVEKDGFAVFESSLRPARNKDQNWLKNDENSLFLA